MTTHDLNEEATNTSETSSMLTFGAEKLLTAPDKGIASFEEC